MTGVNYYGAVLAVFVAIGFLPGRAAEKALDTVSNSNAAVRALAEEVKGKGWIAYAARSGAGDWDIFVSRPDGSQKRNTTRTPNANEGLPRFSPDGSKILYRRIGRQEIFDSNHHGEQGIVVIANSDGSNPESVGMPGAYPWASWSPDGKQIASLSIKGISILDLPRKEVVKTYPRRGFFQQITWSPDGKWLLGVANSYGVAWSIARIEFATGATNAVNRVDCCTPDWFPDSKQVIFSWRPPGQAENKGYGWTQLWRADAEGKSRELVYAEEGRHVYGGCVSPDGQYVLFTGNMQEDGDSENAGSPMALVRLCDTPAVGGESRSVRALHPEAKQAPILTLPAGWEPHWTFSELPGKTVSISPALPQSKDSAALARELHRKGWLVFSAKTDEGDWDLFLSRPDGSERRNISNTPDFNEGGARFSPDGKQMLLYRMSKSEPLDNNTYGTFQLWLAKADGSAARKLGDNLRWASWGPDGNELACLGQRNIQIVEAVSGKVLREFPRKGIVQQLGWSPDGKSFVGTANGLGPFWNIGCLDPETGVLKAVSETERYNCTPDWHPDSEHIIYSRGIIPKVEGRSEIWMAVKDGSSRQVLYAEENYHLYGSCLSPDGNFLLFTRSVEDLGRVDNSKTVMTIIAMKDTPMVSPGNAKPLARVPGAKKGPRVDVGPGWEPHWTYTEISARTISPPQQ